MEIQGVLRELVINLVDIALTPAGAGFFVLPLITILFVIRFLRWLANSSRGMPDVDEISEQFSSYQERARTAQNRIRDTFRRRY